jgi:hypothetical protein
MDRGMGEGRGVRESLGGDAIGDDGQRLGERDDGKGTKVVDGCHGVRRKARCGGIEKEAEEVEAARQLRCHWGMSRQCGGFHIAGTEGLVLRCLPWRGRFGIWSGGWGRG